MYVVHKKIIHPADDFGSTNATALGLLRYALIFVALFPPVGQNRQLDE
jgi:hypothetical protein